MFSERNNYRHLKKVALSRGASLFGVAEISDIKEEFELSQAVKKTIKNAVCLGVGLSSLVLSGIQEEPTKLYFHHYRTANMFLDQLAFGVVGWIQAQGYLALPIPASQITDWQKQRAHVSHKKIAARAGLGWIGRNNLLVTEKFGAQFRLSTVLTDMPLRYDKPLRRGCGTCFACVSFCPVGAIGESSADFNHMACFEKLKEFQKQNIVGQFICGICVKACGRREKIAPCLRA